MRTNKVARFTLLDGLRGLAAILVVQRHTNNFFDMNQIASTYLAVDLFFVLSGFVIAHAFGEKLANGMSFNAFLSQRAVRLLPTYWIGLALAVSVFAFRALNSGNFVAEDFAGSIAFNAFFLPVPPMLSVVGPFMVGPAWSLYWEVLANVVYASNARRTGMTIVVALMTAGAAIMVCTIIARGNLDGGFAYENLYVGSGRVLYSFFAGVLIYRYRKRLSQIIRPSALAAVGLTVLALCLDPGRFRPVYDLIVTLFVLPAIVCFAWPVETSGWKERAANIAGAISYPLYVIHAPLAAWTTTLFFMLSHWAPADFAPWTGMVFLLVSCLIAYLIEVYFDKPVRVAFKRRLQPQLA